MVYFVCESCNETLKKAQVDRHQYSCKNCWGVTCVDCNFTFEGDSFREHTSCVSEDQKYQGALFKAPKAKQKNRGVNEIWADAVLLAASNASSGVAPKPLCAHLVRMGDLGNVPRQEKKFKNFVKNSLRVFDDASVSKLWDYMEGVKNEVTREEKAMEAAAVPAAAPAAAAVVEVEKSAPTAVAPEGETAAGKRKKSKKAKKRRRAGEGNENEKQEQEGQENKKKAKTNGRSRGGSESEEPLRESKLTEGEQVGREGEGGWGGEAGGCEGGITAVDAATSKALVKAAIGIVKKAPNRQLAVKELVKQAAAVMVAKGEGGCTSQDDQRFRRALKQRLKKEGIRRLTVDKQVATYSKGAEN